MFSQQSCPSGKQSPSKEMFVPKMSTVPKCVNANSDKDLAARKMSEHFCARRCRQVGFLVRFGFTTNWVS